MIEFRMLGSTELCRDQREVHSFLTGPKRLGLLAFLLLARPRGFQRRDKVLLLFWPEQGQKAARNALSNLLYHIRRELGKEVVVNRGAEEIGVRRDRLWSDVIAFEEALDRGAEEKALDLYRGDLLEGFHVPGAAPEFGHWLDGERERLRNRAAEGSWLLAARAERGRDRAAARAWAKRAARLAPFSDEAQMRLIALLGRLGDRAHALGAYEVFAARLWQEWKIEPSGALQALAENVRTHAPPGAAAASTPDTERTEDRSIAVLPFETLGTQQPTGFTEGVHGDLVTRLSNVSDLQVISRTSVRRYRNTEKTIPEIGAELSATWVLEGEVQEVTDQVQVNVRLVHAQTDRQAWARDYQRKLTAEDLFQIQSEITREIAQSLEAKLTPEEKKRVGRKPTANLEAYRLFAQGRGYLDQRTEDGMRQAFGCFQRAVEQDPSYALAWAGLTEALSLFQFYGFTPPPDASDPMRAAQRAVELGPDQGETHAALGILSSLWHEGPTAVRELELAVELTPSYAEAHIWLGWVLLCLGKPAQALGPAQRAVELNPLAPAVRVFLAEILLANGQAEEALREAQRARDIQPAYGLSHFMEGLILYHRARYSEARSALEQALLLVPPQGAPAHAQVRAVLAVTQVAIGNQAEALALATHIENAGAPFSAGLVHAAFGAMNAAFEAFDKVPDWGWFATEGIRYFFPDVLAPLRENRRYSSLLRRVDRSWGMGESDADAVPGR